MDSGLVTLYEADVPSVSLGTRVPEQLKKEALVTMSWAPISWKKDEPVKRVKSYISTRLTDRIIDPDEVSTLYRRREDGHCSQNFYCTWGTDGPHLQCSNNYYFQVQGQLAVTGWWWCDFVVYTQKDLTIECIHFSHEHRMQAFSKLEEVYMSCILPMFLHCAGPCVSYKMDH